MGDRARRVAKGGLSPGRSQRPCGQPFTLEDSSFPVGRGSRPAGMDLAKAPGTGFVPVSGRAKYGPLRDSTQQAVPGVLFTSAGSRGVHNRRPVIQVGRRAVLRVPTDGPHYTGVGQSQTGPSQGDTHRPALAGQTVVLHAPVPPGLTPGGTPPDPGPTVAERGPLPQPRVLQAGSLETIGDALRATGVPEDALELTVAGRGRATTSGYEARWGIFLQWCRSQGLNTSAITVENALSFLAHLFNNKGVAAATLSVYVAAISAFLPSIGSRTLGSDPRVTLLLRGARRQRPPQRPVVPQWDLQLVLDSLQGPPYEPPDQASFATWSRKCAFLVSLCSGARGGELAGLGFTDRVHVQEDGAVLRPAPGFVPKVVSAANINRVIHLEPFRPQALTRARRAAVSLLCPVRALTTFLDKSRRIRSCDRLFVSLAPGHQGQTIRAPTLAAWMWKVITDAYVAKGLPVPHVRAHSVRALATSLAELGGASLEDICQAATWAGPNTFAKHYRLGVHRGGYTGITRRVLNTAIHRARRRR